MATLHLTKTKIKLGVPPEPEEGDDTEANPYGGVPVSGRGVLLKKPPLLMEEIVSHVARDGKIVGVQSPKLERQIEAAMSRKTRPWKESEYIYLDGVPHVYTPDKRLGTIIHTRGGGRALLRDAYVRNVSISGPLIYRVDDLYAIGPAKKKRVFK